MGVGVGQCGEKPGAYPPGQVGCTDGGGLGWKLSSTTPSPLASEIPRLALWAWLSIGQSSLCDLGESHPVRVLVAHLCYKMNLS